MVFDYIAVFYKPQRSSLGYLSPPDYDVRRRRLRGFVGSNP